MRLTGQLCIWAVLPLVLTIASAGGMDGVFRMEQVDDPKLKCDVKENSARFDCYPGPDGTSQKACKARGCCWRLPENEPSLNITSHKKPSLGRTINVPYCYFPDNYRGYVTTSVTDTDYGFRAVLKRHTSSGWPRDVMTLYLDVWLETKDRVHFKLYDPANKRYEVPITTPTVTKKASTTDYDVFIQKAPFGIKITRKSSGAALFDSTVPGAPLIFSDQFLQMSTHAGSGRLYGLGEHMTGLQLDMGWTQLTMWNRDINPMKGHNLYGSHPFYLNLEADGQAHGVLLLNSNAMDVDLQPLPAVTFRTIGGVLDFYVFTGPSGDDVTAQYTAVIGRPHVPPYWALGYHLCRWGYGGSAGMKEVIDRNRALGIPYDVQWNDIDYMAAHRDWTYDQKNFSALPQIVDDLHQHGQKYVIIVDPAISSTLPGSYPPYDDGLHDNVFIINNQTNKPLVGMVWPGQTVFPDFTHPNSTVWWYKQAQAFHKQVAFDGFWIDMNDPSSFLFGSTDGCSDNQYDNPPYLPGVLGSDKLPSRTICPSSRQYVSSHYDLHNMYGTHEAQASAGALRKLLGKRSLVISRSSFPSHGLHGGHWTGDVFATWNDMAYTIPAMLKFNLFGIPLVGSDICGFAGNTTEELCIRWTQLGAFYPFSRNHNTIGNMDQDPASFSYRGARVMRTALEVRYSLLPYLYTLFYLSHTQGHTVARPLFFEFPKDAATATIDRQFMWGDKLLISPVLDQGHTSVSAYFPEGRWYDLYEGRGVQGGQWNVLDAPLEKINLHVRGGAVIVLQEPNVTTTLARRQPFHLLVAPSLDGSASGELYWDDGDSLDTVSQGHYNLINFKAVKGSLSSSVVTSGYNVKMALQSIRILGATRAPSSVLVNGQTWKYVFKPDQQEILVENLSLDFKSAFTVQWK